jgi:hypothetical protein
MTQSSTATKTASQIADKLTKTQRYTILTGTNGNEVFGYRATMHALVRLGLLDFSSASERLGRLTIEGMKVLAILSVDMDDVHAEALTVNGQIDQATELRVAYERHAECDTCATGPTHRIWFKAGGAVRTCYRHNSAGYWPTGDVDYVELIPVAELHTR